MTNQLYRDPHILKLLEWPLIQSRVNEFTHFESTTDQRVFTLKDKDTINSIYNLTELFMSRHFSDSLQLLRNQLNFLDSNQGFVDSIVRIKKDALVELKDLNQVVLLIEIYLENFDELNHLQLFNESKDEFHKNKRLYHKNIIKEFRSFISKEGDIDFYKHPLLRKLYKQINETEDTIRKKIQHLKSSDLAGHLQFEGHDVINDRYVVAIKTDTYETQLGQIISRSDSGQTLFVEPMSIKDINYKRLQFIIEFNKEVTSLARKFCHNIKDHIYHLQALSEAVLNFDHLNSISLFAYENDFVRPELLERPSLYLKNVYHPLIEDPVKNNIEIPNDKAGLIISGPNTGGKTASLKTALICILFAQNGLYIPASEAKLHLYQNLFYFGNDGQNLPDGLSSFAAEVQNYTDLFENLAESNLIVIDEIFNSTSSEEASALAISLFDELKKIGHSHLLVSTHHQMLKTYIHQDKSYISAHVGFDIEKNRPTYKLIYGLPGGSQALRIFSLITKSNHINKSIYDNALKVLDKKMVSYENLLEEVSKKEQDINKVLIENRDLNTQLKNQKQSMEGVYKLKLEEKLNQAEKKIKRIIDKAESSLHKAKKGELSKKKILAQESELKSKLSDLSLKKEEKVDKYEHMIKPNEYIIGNEYFSTFLGQTIKLKDIKKTKNQAIVTKGIMTIKCPLNSLRIPGHHKKPTQKININYQSERTGRLEYDCRGMRLEEFQSIVEQSISDLLSSKVPFINIIHGHGTGVLKNWLRSYIKRNKDIKMDKNDTGNDGETRIILS